MIVSLSWSTWLEICSILLSNFGKLSIWIKKYIPKGKMIIKANKINFFFDITDYTKSAIKWSIILISND
jgi:hypothetical protein